MPVGGIFVESLFGARSRQPLVKLTLHDDDPAKPPVAVVEMPPSKAREIAVWLLEAAESALTDAFIARWAREVFSDDLARADAVAVALLRDLRQFRELTRRAGVEQEERDERDARDKYDRDRPM